MLLLEDWFPKAKGDEPLAAPKGDEVAPPPNGELVLEFAPKGLWFGADPAVAPKANGDEPPAGLAPKGLGAIALLPPADCCNELGWPKTAGGCAALELLGAPNLNVNVDLVSAGADTAAPGVADVFVLVFVFDEFRPDIPPKNALGASEAFVVENAEPKADGALGILVFDPPAAAPNGLGVFEAPIADVDPKVLGTLDAPAPPNGNDIFGASVVFEAEPDGFAVFVLLPKMLLPPGCWVDEEDDGVETIAFVGAEFAEGAEV